MSGISGIVAELEQQKAAIERAIEALRDVGPGAAPRKKRGRPPGSVNRAAAPKKASRRMSPEGRARIIAAAKRRWAEFRKAKQAAGNA